MICLIVSYHLHSTYYVNSKSFLCFGRPLTSITIHHKGLIYRRSIIGDKNSLVSNTALITLLCTERWRFDNIGVAVLITSSFVLLLKSCWSLSYLKTFCYVYFYFRDDQFNNIIASLIGCTIWYIHRILLYFVLLWLYHQLINDSRDGRGSWLYSTVLHECNSLHKVKVAAYKHFHIPTTSYSSMSSVLDGPTHGTNLYIYYIYTWYILYTYTCYSGLLHWHRDNISVLIYIRPSTK